MTAPEVFLQIFLDKMCGTSNRQSLSLKMLLVVSLDGDQCTEGS